ncbi:DUF4468 domain-containing protein [Sinomicrobium kalidii]|uniref:DUF4468 domain-containing protein n=1 Tax=Sinomicrobium kalidii TaxID=2900738 RepID=UPI001E4184D5|nr:DUF4468 domain-containing protein [Sinomicrobium kalidii]UGU17719.1 DUF4468 domain-containing protein [Sinomicrobium kalidii]
MKKQLLILFIIANVFGACSVKYIPVTMEPVEKTFEIDGSKEDLYVKANNWMAETFVSSKSVIQFADKEAGIVTGRYLFKDFGGVNLYSGYKDFGEIYAIIKIQVKDNASKITIDAEDFTEVQSSLNESYRFTKEKAIQKINDLITSYESYLRNTDSSF